jgi:hypothetical protein
MIVFWDVTSCSLVEIKLLSRDAIALMMKAVTTSRLIFTRLHDATLQKTGIFKVSQTAHVHCYENDLLLILFSASKLDERG